MKVAHHEFSGVSDRGTPRVCGIHVMRDERKVFLFQVKVKIFRPQKGTEKHKRISANRSGFHRLTINIYFIIICVYDRYEYRNARTRAEAMNRITRIENA